MQILLSFAVLVLSNAAPAADLEAIAKEFDLPAVTQGRLEADRIQVKTVGVRKRGDSVAAKTTDLWHLGSNGKAITASLGAVLIEKGFLSWETKISEVFSSWQIHPDYSDITLKEIFAHRAGITNDITGFQNGKFWKRFVEGVEDVSKLRRDLANAILTSQPSIDRNIFAYSNPGYIIASAMMSEMTGKSWEELVTQFIFKPLNMRSCAFGAAGAESARVPVQPWPHQTLDDGSIYPVSPAHPNADNPKALGPAGTIHCSIQDWLKFAKAHLQGFNGIDTPILSASGFKYLHQDYKGQGYTSGGFIYQKKEGRTYLGHNGSNTMNFAILILDPESNSAFVSATNRGDFKGEKGAQAAMLEMDSPDVCIGKTCLLTK